MDFGGKVIEATVDESGRIIMPEEVQNIMAAGMAVIQKAGQRTSNENNDDVQQNKLGDPVNNFKGLPMRELIGAPLFAAAEAQERLASIAWDYYQKNRIRN